MCECVMLEHQNTQFVLRGRKLGDGKKNDPSILWFYK